jgi:pSer/pThr/pTyr-binding forkhead associated (FHA) protein
VSGGANGSEAATVGAPGPELFLVYELERRAYQLRSDFTIGRDTESDLVVLEPSVSRTHARVTAGEEGFVLENVGPTGTRVNGQKLAEPYRLAYGDKVEIGTAVLTVRSAPLPLGVSTADRSRTRVLDAVTARRATIRHPLMVERPVEEEAALPWGWLLLLAAVVTTVVLLFARG